MEKLALPVDATRGPNCGLTALAVAAGVTLREATAAYADVYPSKLTKRWRGATYWPYTVRALTRLGVGYVDDTPMDPRYPRCIRKRMTLKTFVKKHALPGKRYMIRTTGHVQVVQDSMVIDQGGVRHIDEYRGAGKIVKDALRLNQ